MIRPYDRSFPPHTDIVTPSASGNCPRTSVTIPEFAACRLVILFAPPSPYRAAGCLSSSGLRSAPAPPASPVNGGAAFAFVSRPAAASLTISTRSRSLSVIVTRLLSMG